MLLAGMAAEAGTTQGWKLVWSDEFNGPAGSQPDPANWNYDLGNNNGWGNGEAEVYTNSPNNVFEDGKGNLVIRAIRDASGKYTSGRLQTGSPGASTHTADLNWQFGKIEARMKLPFGKGVWPAFWMLGENINAVGWPAAGEIDIMENFGTFHNNVSVTNGTVHGPGYSGAGGVSKSYNLPFGEKVADEFHVYAIEWSADSIQWSVDGVPYQTVTPASLPAGQTWVFNRPFFILLNLAIGGPGTFLGTPDANSAFPSQDMLVDYVRVYQTVPVSEVTPVIAPGRIVNSASYLGSIAPGSLVTLYGDNLADGSYHASASPAFPAVVAGVSVTVAGVSAPLIFVSETQINFQIPWGTLPGQAVNIKVTRNGVDSNIETVTIAGSTAPALFLNDFATGLAWVTGTGCVVTECSVETGGEYQLWANGLGPKNSPESDGTPVSGTLTQLEVPGSPAACQLTIGGQPARVDYCGAGPGGIIDQINFAYPAGVPANLPYVDATLSVHDATINFRVPSPASTS